MAKRDELNNIKSRLFSRGLTLTKWGLKASSFAARKAVGSSMSKEFLLKQMESLTKDLGELKGSLMKVGQMLSMYGEHFLPKEANAFLKQLQFQSPPLAWPAIEKQLLAELSKEVLAELEIDQTSFASASLGQVHIARRKSDGKKLAVKIQYPGVDAAIDNDLKILKTFLTVAKLVPSGERFNDLWNEIRAMLHQEVDYKKELEFTQEFKLKLADDPRYIVPEVFPRYSSGHVLTTEFIDGLSLDDEKVLGLSLERRNRLGLSYLDLYFRELMEFEAVQTDPHLGNYRVKLHDDGQDQLVLLDFGAVRKIPKDFLKIYLTLIRGAFEQKDEWIIEAGQKLEFLTVDDPMELVASYVALCLRITEPFANPEWNFAPRELMDSDGVYDWENSDLPKRVALLGAEMVFKFKLRAPPREVIFLDRKLGGAFVVLSVLNCHLNARPLLQKWLDQRFDGR